MKLHTAKQSIIALLVGVTWLASCANGAPSRSQEPVPPPIPKAQITNANFVHLPDPSMIRYDVERFGSDFDAFDKYVTYDTTNGAILLIAQNRISNEQLLRAWNILDFYLTDVDGSTFGQDKSIVKEFLAANHAVLAMPNGRDEAGIMGDQTLPGQPLYELEFPIEGSKHYLHNDYEYRDAGFEEIFHMVHQGIGSRFTEGALSDSYRLQIKKAKDNAMENYLWPTQDSRDAFTQEWIEVLAEEGSLEHEYIASVIDSYYGYWGAFTETSGGMWGIYTAKTREDVKRLDPMGYQLMQDFLSEYITFTARISPDFSGTFHMNYDPSKSYTHKSQYLLNARLTGDNPANLHGNDQDNMLIGNASNNILDGQAGTDTVQVFGFSKDYEIKADGNVVMLINLSTQTVDTLKNIEMIRFYDADHPL